MDTEKIRAAGIDYDRGVKRFMGRANLYEKALNHFMKDGAFSRIQSAYQAGDREALLASAHEFKGMCGNISLNLLSEMGDEIVRMMRADAYSQNELDQAYARLEKEYNTVYAAILEASEVAS